MDEFDEIVREFLVESYENLDQLDRDLVALEQEPDAHPLLQSIFRTIHTIKGTSGFLAFGKLEVLTHAGEGLLARLRDGGLRLTQERTTGLLQLIDAVRGILASIEATGSEDDRDYTELVDATHRSADPGARDGVGQREPQATRTSLDEGARPGRRAESGETAAPGEQSPATDRQARARERRRRTRRRPTNAGVAAAGRDSVAKHDMKAAQCRTQGETGAPAEPTSPPSNVPLLGELLQQQADINAEDVAVAMLEQQLGDKRPLGEILVDHGQATPDQVREALAMQAAAKAERASAARSATRRCASTSTCSTPSCAWSANWC